MTLIGLAGYKGSGKSIVAQRLVDQHGFVRIPLADVLKDMLIAFGLTEEQVRGSLKEVIDDNLLCGKTPRWAMQSLGTEWARDLIGPDVWVRAWWAKVQPILDMGGSVVADDVRFVNEVDIIHRYQGFVIRVDRPGYEPQPQPVKWWDKLIGRKPEIHPSERIDFPIDYVLQNEANIPFLQRETDRLLKYHRRKHEWSDNLLEFGRGR